MESKEVIALLVDIIKEMGSYKAAKPKNKMKVGSTRQKLQFDVDDKPMIQHETEKEPLIESESIPTTEFSKNVLETLIDQNTCPPNSAAKYPCLYARIQHRFSYTNICIKFMAREVMS